jgi:hypothetical protein
LSASLDGIWFGDEVDLLFRAGKFDRRVSNAEARLQDWRKKEKEFGQLYLEH